MPLVIISDDFSEYGHAGVPAFDFWLGAAEPAKFEAAKKLSETLPGLHSPCLRLTGIPVCAPGLPPRLRQCWNCWENPERKLSIFPLGFNSRILRRRREPRDRRSKRIEPDPISGDENRTEKRLLDSDRDRRDRLRPEFETPAPRLALNPA